MEDRVENLMEAGVLDPAKVTRSGLMNACSIAGIMLTTQVHFILCHHSRFILPSQPLQTVITLIKER